MVERANFSKIQPQSLSQYNPMNTQVTKF
ncbi:hypothetical protein CCACVL1_00104 [Corchorus capsularis]|uniref:Uncharacterized protein n=1 Tax=Corchorus capsularis TaxID=210143 RepID=A0A1R3KYJ6_COCAP|nr:hypothetical protein CCACVL1_00104 [Corchorus capsularis]